MKYHDNVFTKTIREIHAQRKLKGLRAWLSEGKTDVRIMWYISLLAFLALLHWVGIVRE